MHTIITDNKNEIISGKVNRPQIPKEILELTEKNWDKVKADCFF